MNIQSKTMKLFALTSLVLLSSSSALANENNYKNAQAAYTKVCAYCHQEGGVGPNTINIKSDNLEARVSMIEAIVRNGMNGMPSFRKTEIDNKMLKELATSLAKGELK